MIFKNKRILITAGPTWVPIDQVRVISNIASGETGILLAKNAVKKGLRVTLLLGPTQETPKLSKKITIRRFCYFSELEALIKTELKTKHYDVFIHSAAVSDYQVEKLFKGKIKSDSRKLYLKLKKTRKIVNIIKKYAPNIFLVLFKLELNTSRLELIKRARKAMSKAKADLAVANTFIPKYKAFIIDKKNIFSEINSKTELCDNLLQIIEKS